MNTCPISKDHLSGVTEEGWTTVDLADVAQPRADDVAIARNFMTRMLRANYRTL